MSQNTLIKCYIYEYFFRGCDYDENRKNFYSEEHEHWSKIEKSIDEFNNSLSLEQRKAQDEQTIRNAREMINNFEKREKHTQRIPNKEKIKKFKMISKLAYEFAEIMMLDILIEDESSVYKGNIELKGDCLFFTDSTDLENESREILAMLIKSADFISIKIKDGMLIGLFSYDLYDERYIYEVKL